MSWKHLSDKFEPCQGLIYIFFSQNCYVFCFLGGFQDFLFEMLVSPLVEVSEFTERFHDEPWIYFENICFFIPPHFFSQAMTCCSISLQNNGRTARTSG